MIGIFDSGNGGLTVLTALKTQLPQQQFIYLGDHARAPYGGKSHEDILAHSTQMVSLLFDQGCNLVVVACNTASAVALRCIQEKWLPENAPNKRVLGVLVPMVEAITGMPWDRDNPGLRIAKPQRIGLFATQTTVNARSYVEEVEKRSPNSTVFQQACPGLAHAIEANASTQDLEEMVKNYVDQLLETANGDLDSVLLGCTHYPLLQDIFTRHLPEGIQLYSQGNVVADALSHYLDRHPEFKGTASGNGSIQFLTTAKPDTIAPLSSIKMGEQFMPGFNPKFIQI